VDTVKSLILAGILCTTLSANDDIKVLQFGISTSYEEKEIYIQRLKHPKCLKVGVTPDNIFGGDLAGKNVPKECRKNFVTSLGVIQPIQLDEDIQTVGELEVLKLLQMFDFEPDKYALVDTRGKEWFEKITIPHAINIAKSDMILDVDFPEDFVSNLKQLNVKQDKKGKLDFTNAKHAIIFCNGSWCTQSAKAIKELVKLGYPKKKLFWYRGGLQDWVGSGFTVVKH